MAGGLAAGEHRGVVAREDAGVEKLDPVAAVGRARDRLALFVVAPGEQHVVRERAAAQQRLGDPVREEGVGVSPVDLSELIGDQPVDGRAGDLGHPTLGEMSQGVEQVGAHVRVHAVPREGAGDPPPGKVLGAEGCDGVRGELEKRLAEFARVPDHRAHSVQAAASSSWVRPPSWTSTR